MTTQAARASKLVQVGDCNLEVFRGGRGPALLSLHGARGNPGWMPFHQELAASHSVHAPSHPGYNGSDRPDWVTSIADVARLHLAYLRQETPGEQAIIMGFSMGGWIAAEIPSC